MERIRNAVRALIMEDDRLLCIKKERPEVGVYYALPGEAHEPNETLEETLRRECEEELGSSVADLRLLCVREYV
ncbi:NUDIX domain-containing protein [Paenibacillus thiaminolyticus]|uniref:NUDIX domain-containing protein n=1 Tax=Paenibacillus thiaminolyticus TaxID=49283 RepID=UPI0035A6CDA1